MSENEIIECLLDGKPFVFDPATHFCHADDGGAPEHGIKYVPAAQVQDAPVAEIVSAHGDPEAFGERELVARVDIQKFPYGTKLYTALSIETFLSDFNPVMFISEKQIGCVGQYLPTRKSAEGNFQLALYAVPRAAQPSQFLNTEDGEFNGNSQPED